MPALQLEADLLGDHLAAGEDRDVVQHGLAPVTEARGLDGDGLEGAADLVDDQRGQGLAVDVLGDDHQRLAGLHDLLQQREQVLDRADLGVGDQHVRVLEHGLHALGVGHEVGRDVALVEPHALGELEVQAEGVGLLDGDDAFLADLVHRLGDDLADGGVAGGDRRGGGDLLLGLDVLGHAEQLLGDRATAVSMPRLRLIGFAPAATLRRPSRTMAWARTVAVVVPSPATSSVFLATSLTSSAPIFSYGSSSSISLAMVTPSLVIVGAPHFFSSTTLRPFGPRVTLTASARVFIPFSSPRRASSLKAISFGITPAIPSGSLGCHPVGCPRRTARPCRRTLLTGRCGPQRSPGPVLSLSWYECQSNV